MIAITTSNSISVNAVRFMMTPEDKDLPTV